MTEVDKLCFSYTNKPFIENVSFYVEREEIFSFLGPSGAGRPTIQKVLTGLNIRYKGSIRVARAGIRERTNRFYERIDVDSGFSTCYEKFTTREDLEYFGPPYNRPLRSTEELLRMTGLENDDDKKIPDFSKGTRSRLDFIKALVYSPDILSLDEPISGLDPTNNKLMKDTTLAERKHGKMIIITTHNMFDVTELCDQVAFIVSGKVDVLDTPHNLIVSRGAAKIRYVYSENGEETDGCVLTQTSDDKRLDEPIRSNSLRPVYSSEPTLNDIFVDITGRTL